MVEGLFLVPLPYQVIMHCQVFNGIFVVSDTHWSLIFMRFSGNYIVITSDFGAKESSRPPHWLPYMNLRNPIFCYCVYTVTEY